MKAGEILGERYRIESRIAGGGMGTVFTATDERLGRTVALKLLKDSLVEDPRLVERFRREARAAAALSHPNIASVYDYGIDGPRHYIVMELAQGRDLARILRDDAPLEPERAAGIATQIAAALGHAHAAGLVHRDVKPANAIVGDDGRVKVTDFGIARVVGDTTLTATGTIMGTAAYLSPEQAQGSPVDARTDVYSLGIVLYEMLTGEVPFTGDSAVSVAMKHVTDDVPLPSRIAGDIPDELDRIVQTATARDLDKRYTDGNALASDLRKVADTAPGSGPIAAVTEILEDERDTRLLPLPTGPWNPEKLGRVVLLTLAGLFALAALLLLWRVSQNKDPAASKGPGEATEQASQASQSPEESPSATPTPSASASGFELLDGIIGSDFRETKKFLEGLGFDVEEVKESSDAEKHTVVDVDPDVGTVVIPGEDTITLYVSDGKGDEDEDDDD